MARRKWLLETLKNLFLYLFFSLSSWIYLKANTSASLFQKEGHWSFANHASDSASFTVGAYSDLKISARIFVNTATFCCGFDWRGFVLTVGTIIRGQVLVVVPFGDSSKYSDCNLKKITDFVELVIKHQLK